MLKPNCPARNDRDEPNLFSKGTRGGSRGKVKGRRRKPPKSKPVMKVGGRKVSAAIVNKNKYVFPVEISHISDSNQ
jgi:hypothetical protein